MLDSGPSLCLIGASAWTVLYVLVVTIRLLIGEDPESRSVEYPDNLSLAPSRTQSMVCPQRCHSSNRLSLCNKRVTCVLEDCFLRAWATYFPRLPSPRIYIGLSIRLMLARSWYTILFSQRRVFDVWQVSGSLCQYRKVPRLIVAERVLHKVPKSL